MNRSFCRLGTIGRIILSGAFSDDFQLQDVEFSFVQ